MKPLQPELTRLSLFGLDLSLLLDRWRAGWRELFWGRASGIRRRLDAPVALRSPDGECQWFVAEEPLQAPPAHGAAAFEALLLPAGKVLFIELSLPLAYEADLADALALEVRANSPFPRDDTCFGWTITGRDGGQTRVLLAMSSLIEIRGYLRSAGVDLDDRDALPELWCREDNAGPAVVLQGYGERRRERAYRGRLRSFAVLSAVAILLLAGLLVMPGLVRKLQADNMAYHVNYAETQAREALRLRDALTADNDRLLALQALLAEQHDLHGFLEALTALAPDSVYLEQLTIEGRNVRARGWAVNAAAFMQRVAEDPAYTAVSSPSGIRRHGRTNLEQFVLEFTLAASADTP